MSNSTFNIHSLAVLNEGIEIELEMYGTQDVILKTNNFEFISINSNNQNLIVNNYTWNFDAQILKINIKGINMQGERGKIVILGNWHLSDG